MLKEIAGNYFVSGKLMWGGYGAMFRYAIDLNTPVTLEANRLDAQSVVNALSDALKCNVFIDGYIEEVSVLKPGTYRAQEVLNMAFRAWSCTAENDGKNLYFLRDFTREGFFTSRAKEGQFPTISQEEMVAFTSALSERLSTKYPSLVNGERGIGMVIPLRQIVQKMSVGEQEQAETKNGIVIGSLKAPLQEDLSRIFYVHAFGRLVHPWSAMRPILENLNRLRAKIDYRGIQFSGPGEQFDFKIGVSGKKQDEVKLAALQVRLEKGCARVVDYAKKFNLQAPIEIQRHFISAAALVDEPSFFAALARLHGWKFQQIGGNRASLQPVKPGVNDSVMMLLPAEYLRFLQSGKGPYSMPPFTGTYMRAMGGELYKDAELYSLLFQKLLGKREQLDMRTATELETYALTRILFHQTAMGSLGQIVTTEDEPVYYALDYKNATLAINRTRNDFTVSHPKGGGFSVGSSFLPPITTLGG